MNPTFAQTFLKWSIPGAQVALMSEGSITQYCFGTTHLSEGSPVTQESRFPFGSATKPFTAFLLGLLDDDSTVDLDQPVTNYLSWWSVEEFPAPTIAQLLSHTSGLVGDFDDEVAPRHGSLLPFARSLNDQVRVGAPGATFSYSNSGYALAAAIAEQETGQSWWELIDGLISTYYDLGLGYLYSPAGGVYSPHNVGGHTVSATSSEATPVPLHCEPALTPAGGLAGSAYALLTLAANSVSESTEIPRLHTMWSPQPATANNGISRAWGNGFAVYGEHTSLPVFGHDGSLDGATAQVRFNPQTGHGIALTTNATSGLQAFSECVNFLELEHGWNLAGTPSEDSTEKAPNDICGSELDLDGTFANGDLTVTVSAADGGYRCVFSNGMSGTLVPKTRSHFDFCSDEFAGRPVPGELLFTDVSHAPRGTTQSVQGLRLIGRVLRRAA